ncbi:MAG TPA: molecular chaperone HtpG, partial [Deltaproteobacteria bacterium]|nr:molecular chaperone HtpG [Deltaproteobacteria bacterium]
LPEQMRRMNDIGALMEQRLPGLPDHHILLVNRQHPLVEALLNLESGSVVIADGASSPSHQLAVDLAQHLYDLARLAVGGLEPTELGGFQARATMLMSSLLQRGT